MKMVLGGRVRCLVQHQRISHCHYFQCFADQKAKIEALDGEAECLSAYRFNHTPTPSEQAKMCFASYTPYKPMDS